MAATEAFYQRDSSNLNGSAMEVHDPSTAGSPHPNSTLTDQERLQYTSIACWGKPIDEALDLHLHGALNCTNATRKILAADSYANWPSDYCKSMLELVPLVTAAQANELLMAKMTTTSADHGDAGMEPWVIKCVVADVQKHIEHSSSPAQADLGNSSTLHTTLPDRHRILPDQQLQDHDAMQLCLQLGHIGTTTHAECGPHTGPSAVVALAAVPITHFRFFDLPLELRLEVYRHVYSDVKLRVGFDMGVPDVRFTQRLGHRRNIADIYNLLVNKRWCHEATPVLYADSLWQSRTDLERRREEQTATDSILRVRSLPLITAHIRTIRFTLSLMNAEFDADNVRLVSSSPALTKVVVLLTLKHSLHKAKEEILKDDGTVMVWKAIARAKVARVALEFPNSSVHGLFSPSNLCHDIIRIIREQVELPADHDLGAYCPWVGYEDRSDWMFLRGQGLTITMAGE